MTISDPQTRVGCDVQDIRLIHRVFRAVFAEAAAWPTATGDTPRRSDGTCGS